VSHKKLRRKICLLEESFSSVAVFFLLRGYFIGDYNTFSWRSAHWAINRISSESYIDRGISEGKAGNRVPINGTTTAHTLHTSTLTETRFTRYRKQKPSLDNV